MEWALCCLGSVLEDPGCGSEKLVLGVCGPIAAKRHRRGQSCLGLVGKVVEGSTVGSEAGVPRLCWVSLDTVCGTVVMG